MPRGDRTGPAGMGPLTGRSAGYCAGYPVPGFENSVFGRGYGGGRGQGRGRGGGGRGWRHRHWYYATGLTGWQRAAAAWPGGPPPPVEAPAGPFMTRDQALEAMKQQAKYYEKMLDDLKRQISEAESSEETSKTP
jgi:hypothetical protein